MSDSDQSSKPSTSRPLRLALATERFWPLSGQIELTLGELVREIEQKGHQIKVISTKWGKDWPSLFDFGGVPVQRIARYSAGPWASYRYAKSYFRYFQNQSELDGIIVTGANMVTNAVLRAAIDRIPVVTYLTRSTLRGSYLYRMNPRFFDRLARCRAVITDCPVLQASLGEFNSISNLQSVVAGVKPVQQRPSLASQSAARMALTEAHPVLAIETGQPLVVTSLELENDGGLFDLIDAWTIVLRTFPRARLWVLGDGPAGSAIWKQIVQRELVQSVILPGYFDDISDLLVAADLYVHPGRTSQAAPGLLRAMAGYACVVSTDNAWSNRFLEADVNSLIAPRRQPQALAEAILLGLQNSDLRTRLAGAAARTAQTEFSIGKMADQLLSHLTLPVEPGESQNSVFN